MKLLVITQKVDKNDPVLGFFHNWILELSKKLVAVSVICLEKGEYDLPQNVKIYSLGKESKKSRIKYVTNFYNYIVGLNREYDAVFVHMNQEYVLLGGMFWKLLRKKVYFWRNHPHGNFLARVAVFLSDKMFCTSKFSYTARFSKTTIMPVGIDTNLFKSETRNPKFETKNKILSLGRISPVKNIHLIIGAAKILKERGVDFVLDIVGDSVNPEDMEYKSRLIESSKGLPINFLHGVSNDRTPEIYSTHKIFVNLTPSGSFDKTILEAAACGALPVVTNESLRGEIDQKLITEAEAGAVADTLEYWLRNTNVESTQKELENYVIEKHSLHALIEKLCSEIKK
jgi:glycosyltransferase involved in cell wall biosynthesis